MPARFDHEKLSAYQRSLEFVEWTGELLASIRGKHAVAGQLDRASTSIPLNIAEVNGRFSAADVLVARKLATPQCIEMGKQQLIQIVSMLVGLIRSNSENRLHEAEVSYRC